MIHKLTYDIHTLQREAPVSLESFGLSLCCVKRVGAEPDSCRLVFHELETLEITNPVVVTTKTILYTLSNKLATTTGRLTELSKNTVVIY